MCRPFQNVMDKQYFAIDLSENIVGQKSDKVSS